MSKAEDILRRLHFSETDLDELSQAELYDDTDNEQCLVVIEQAKAQLLQLILDEVIGEVTVETRGNTQNPENEKYWTKATLVRNKLINEQRQALRNLFGMEEK